MHPNYDARMDPQMYNEYMHCHDPDYVPSQKSSSRSGYDNDRNAANEPERESSWSSDGVEITRKPEIGSANGSDGELQFNRSISK